jgi:hypothetical protein
MSTSGRPLPGGKLEYAVLVALWESGPLSAPEVHDRVGVPLDLVYTTTPVPSARTPTRVGVTTPVVTIFWHVR